MRRGLIVWCVLVAGCATVPSGRGAGLPVIPGAEGFGVQTPAGRRGKIVRVTNLDDEGPGSLRAALRARGPRTVIFEVSGTIPVSRALVVSEPFLTIAGQTAPSPGIMLRGAGIIVRTHDVLIQHLRIRVGDEPSDVKPDDRDGISVLGPASNVVVDHLSFSWAVDENASAWYQPHDVTFRYCIFSEGLQESIHPKHAHSKGLLLGQGSQRIAVLRNLFAHNADRHPFIKDGVSAVVANNVMYNWQAKMGGATVIGSAEHAGPVQASVVGNVYLAGVNTHEPVPVKEGQPPKPVAAIRLHKDLEAGSAVYLHDNRAEGVPLLLNQASFDPLVPKPPIWTDPLTVLPSADTLDDVFQQAGARPIERDAVDVRIVEEARSRTGRIIDSPADVGGWPEVPATRRPLDPPSSRADADGDGYTDLEEWLHGLAAEVEGRSVAAGGAR